MPTVIVSLDSGSDWGSIAAAVSGLLGAAIGGLLSLLATWLSQRAAAKEAARAREEGRRDRAAEARFEALLGLQEAQQEFARETTRAALDFEEQYARGMSWADARCGDETSERQRLAAVRVGVYAARAADEEIAAASDDLRARGSDAVYGAGSTAEVDAALSAMMDAHERLGGLVAERLKRGPYGCGGCPRAADRPERKTAKD